MNYDLTHNKTKIELIVMSIFDIQILKIIGCKLDTFSVRGSLIKKT